LEEGTTYRIMPYFKNGKGGTYYDKAILYPECGGGLDGDWGPFTISGSTGVINNYGEQILRGLTSTGDLTWFGQALEEIEEYDENNVLVSLHKEWIDAQLTMTADR